jgi:prophage DNA circulation protein
MADLPTLPTVTISAPALPSVSPPAKFPYLHPASWKGVPFGVRSSGLSGGRKVSVHQYPFRDQQWPEDMGRKGRGLRFQDFLLDGGGQYGGQGSIEAQAAAMVKACETAGWGWGYLIHPLFGQLQMQLTDFSADQAEAPGVLELSFAAMAKAAQSFAIGIEEDVHTALGDLQITSTLQSFTSIANTVATTATSLVSMVGSLPGEFGRFVGQTVADAEKTATSVQELAGIGAADREGCIGRVRRSIGGRKWGRFREQRTLSASVNQAPGAAETA